MRPAHGDGNGNSATEAWERQEAGWWTSEKGAVCLERNGKWAAYLEDASPKLGTFRTMREAMQFVEGTR